MGATYSEPPKVCTLSSSNNQKFTQLPSSRSITPSGRPESRFRGLLSTMKRRTRKVIAQICGKEKNPSQNQSSSHSSQEDLLRNVSYVPLKEIDSISSRWDERTLPRKVTCPLQSLPPQLFHRILEKIRGPALVCLKLSCKSFFSTVSIKKSELGDCARWLITTRLENDLIKKGEALPDELACAFCKKKHPQEMFRMLGSNGVETLGMAKSNFPSYRRYCWLHFPKRVCYSPDFRDSQQASWAQSLVRDHWVATWERMCMHCGERLIKDPVTSDERCPVCSEKCNTCGYAGHIYFSRYGPQRLLQSFECIRLIKRRTTGYALEMEEDAAGYQNRVSVTGPWYSLIEKDFTSRQNVKKR